VRIRLAMWGAGFGVAQLVQMFQDGGIKVTGVYDVNPRKWGTVFHGVPVTAPDTLMESPPDVLLITCMAVEAVTKQAVAMGLEREKILPYYGNQRQAMCALGINTYCFDYDLQGDELCVMPKVFRVSGKMIQDVPAEVPQEVQLDITARLMDAYILANQSVQTVPETYQTGTNWKGVFDSCMSQFYAACESRDVEALKQILGNFCRHPISTCIMGGDGAFQSFAMATEQEPWVQHNLHVWTSLVEDNASLNAIAMPPIGNPYGYIIDGHIINWNSVTNNGRASRCLRLLEEVSRPLVAEIGGGFGGLAYHLVRNEKPLTYINFDLPENLAISSYYISMAFPEARILLYEGKDISLAPEVLTQYDAVFMPNFMLPAMQDCSVDLFVNTISFSEMEMATIREYFSQIDRICARYFYHENLSCHPEYRGYPTRVFPRLRNFHKLFMSFSPWMGFDAYSLGHSYLESLFERRA